MQNALIYYSVFFVVVRLIRIVHYLLIRFCNLILEYLKVGK
jgi:hypothetical protein